MSAINGYVKIPADHPWREFEGYDDLPVTVHGGLTFGPRAAYGNPFSGREEPAITWADTGGWVGFDTLHAWDMGDISVWDRDKSFPQMRSNWTQESVEVEVWGLADQVAQAWHPEPEPTQEQEESNGSGAQA